MNDHTEQTYRINKSRILKKLKKRIKNTTYMFSMVVSLIHTYMYIQRGSDDIESCFISLNFNNKINFKIQMKYQLSSVQGSLSTD